MFADVEREANDLDSHGDLWRASELSAARPTAHAAGSVECSANAEAAAGVPPAPAHLRAGTLIENAGRLNAIQQLIGRLHGSGSSEMRDSLELLRTHFLDQSSGTASTDLLDDFDMLRKALDSLPASGSGASEPPTPQPPNPPMPSDEPLAADITDDSLLWALYEMQQAAAAERAQSSGEQQAVAAAASDQSVKSARTQQSAAQSASAMTESITEPPSAIAEDGFSLAEALELGKLAVRSFSCYVQYE